MSRIWNNEIFHFPILESFKVYSIFVMAVMNLGQKCFSNFGRNYVLNTLIWNWSQEGLIYTFKGSITRWKNVVYKIFKTLWMSNSIEFLIHGSNFPFNHESNCINFISLNLIEYQGKINFQHVSRFRQKSILL